MGKSSINGPFSMAMLNNQRVIYIYILIIFLNWIGRNHLSPPSTVSPFPSEHMARWAQGSERSNPGL